MPTVSSIYDQFDRTSLNEAIERRKRKRQKRQRQVWRQSLMNVDKARTVYTQALANGKSHEEALKAYNSYLAEIGEAPIIVRPVPRGTIRTASADAASAIAKAREMREAALRREAEERAKAAAERAEKTGDDMPAAVATAVAASTDQPTAPAETKADDVKSNGDAPAQTLEPEPAGARGRSRRKPAAPRRETKSSTAAKPPASEVENVTKDAAAAPAPAPEPARAELPKSSSPFDDDDEVTDPDVI